MNINNYVNSSYFHPSMSFPGQETFPRIESSGFHTSYRYQNPRKKRTKFIKVDNSLGGSSSSGVTKPKCSKKPDPSAPKITRPCSECGKKFWSWKALFGHMRCHPERQWRGINPPPNFLRLETAAAAAAVSTDREGTASGVTEEDHEVATCLLMLANGGSVSASESPSVTNVCSTGMLESDSGGGVGIGNFRFECLSCKKVFGSHQALGGHRASHKNVKGCYAINKNVEIGEEEEEEEEQDWINSGGQVEHQLMDDIGHKCSICLRVFSTGQALGGHKRCHWEKVSEEAWLNEANCGLDLNFPASAAAAAAPAPVRVPVHEDDVTSSASFYSSGLELDLRLGL